MLTVTLSQGAKRMARKKVIVKQLSAIENFGSIEILCSDKTGTLTLGEVTLQRSVDVRCNDDDRVLEWVYLNSFFEAGMKDPLDDAILAHPHPDIAEFTKLDEIPFDFERRRLSVVVRRKDERTLITKGAAEDLFDVCTTVQVAGDGDVPFDAMQRKLAEQSYQQLSSDGYRVLGVAIRSMDARDDYRREDECELTLVGFAAFLDPPKQGVAETLKALARDGMRVLVMTGDNQYVTRKVAMEVGLPADNIIVGTQVDAMNDAALAVQAEQGAMFARVSPEQKNRVITALKGRGWVVGFLGDGINDAPSLHAADVGISVVNGVDVAQDAANIILLEKDLGVLHDGVLRGPRQLRQHHEVHHHGHELQLRQHVQHGRRLALPALPADAADADPAQQPALRLLADGHPERQRRRRAHAAAQAMEHQLHPAVHGHHWPDQFDLRLPDLRACSASSTPTSALPYRLVRGIAGDADAGGLRHPHGGQSLKSRASRSLTLAVLAVALIAFVLPYTPLGTVIGFTPMPLLLVGTIVVFAATYLGLVQIVKTWFYRHHELI